MASMTLLVMMSLLLSADVMCVVDLAARGSRFTPAPNACHLAPQEGCRYLLTLQPSDLSCHFESSFHHSSTDSTHFSGSSPLPSKSRGAPAAGPTRSNASTLGPDALKRKGSAVGAGDGLRLTSGESTGSGLDAVIRRLDQLERHLTRLVEELSVKSLRNTRQTKQLVKQLTKQLHSQAELSSRISKNASAAGGEDPREAHAGSAGCPADFCRVTSWPSCYRLSAQFNATWHEAREYCSAFGANLLAVESLKEAHIVDYLLKTQPGMEEVERWWTSGSYMLRNQRWMWTSKHHLKPITYTRWAASASGPALGSTFQANVTSSAPPPSMQCMLIDRALKYQWVEAACADRNNFICELDP